MPVLTRSVTKSAQDPAQDPTQDQDQDQAPVPVLVEELCVYDLLEMCNERMRDEEILFDKFSIRKFIKNCRGEGSIHYLTIAFEHIFTLTSSTFVKAKPIEILRFIMHIRIERDRKFPLHINPTAESFHKTFPNILDYTRLELYMCGYIKHYDIDALSCICGVIDHLMKYKIYPEHTDSIFIAKNKIKQIIRTFGFEGEFTNESYEVSKRNEFRLVRQNSTLIN